MRFIRSYIVASKNLSEFADIIYSNSRVQFTGLTTWRTVNKGMWIDILRRLRDAVRKKRLGKLKTRSRFLLHDNAPAHRSVLVKDFLTKINVITMEHPPLLAAADFYLLLRLQSALKGRHFCVATDIRWKSWKGFHKMASRNVSNTFAVASRSLLLHKGSILMAM